MFLASAPCPTGWHFDPSLTRRYARLEVDCGLFPLKKTIGGKLTHTLLRAKWKPVEEYLRSQGRFRHLFEPVRQDEIIQQMQDEVDRYWESVRVPSRLI
jgi:pyruvate ferredoxin oxidoreductase beta subunit